MKSISYLLLLCAFVFLSIGNVAAARIWKNIHGQEIEADFGGIMDKGGVSQVQMKKPNGQSFFYPLNQLSQSDQDFVAKELMKPRPESSYTAAKPTAKADSSSKTSPSLSSFEKSFSSYLVSLQKKKLKRAELPEGGTEYYAFYFSAHWCPPCRAFTPELSKFYKRFKKRGNFSIVFVSSDRSEKAMAEYMDWGKMKFLAIDYAKIGSVGKITSMSGSGIPSLVVTDKNGKVLHNSYEKGKYVGPGRALDVLEDKIKG